MAKNRTQLFQDLGVEPTNPRWSWCAKKPEIKRAVFTLWEDKELPNYTWLIHDSKDDYKRNGHFDQERTLRLAIKENYEILGIVCIAQDIEKSPRNIKEVKDDFVYRLRVKDEGDKIYLIKVETVKLIEIIRKDRNLKSNNNALKDLNVSDLGSDIPDRAFTSGFTVKRDQNVRKAVLKRANGKCEYCGSASFQTGNGESYLETHHIIYLANQGKDKISNVIALCPNHHREAHFGVNAIALEKEFLKIITIKHEI